MKILTRIIYKTIVYSSPAWLFYFYLEYRLGILENSYSFKIQHFNAIKDSCRVLVLGNSEMMKGINPDFIPQPAFNMAHVSQNYVVDELILQKYISQLPQLKLVVLGLSYLSFGDDLQNGEETWRISFYKKHYGVALNNGFDAKDYSNTLRYTPYEAFKLCLNNFNTDLVNGIQANGWMQAIGSDSTHLTDEFARQRATMHTKSLRLENVSKNIMALRNIIVLLKKRNIRILLMAPPVMQNYSRCLDQSWLARNDSLVNLLTLEYKLEVVDFTKANDSFYNTFEGGFSDVNHLNKDGADWLGIVLGCYVFETKKE